MMGPVARTSRRIAEARPLVRPTRNELEVRYLPPFGDPEVHIPGEVATYALAGLAVNAVTDLVGDD